MSAVVSSHSDASGYSSGESLLSIKDEDFDGLLESFSSGSQRSGGCDAGGERSSSTSVSRGDAPGAAAECGLEALPDDEPVASPSDEGGVVILDEGVSSVEGSGGGHPTGERTRKRKTGGTHASDISVSGGDGKKSKRSASDSDEGGGVDAVASGAGDAKTSKKRPSDDGELQGEDVKRRKGSNTEAGSASCPPHPGYMYGLCVRCGAEKGEDGGDAVPLSYVHRGLEFSKEEAERVAEAHATSLVNQGRLNLVLDLDLTLLNTCGILMVSEEHRSLCDAWQKKEAIENRRQSLFCIPHAGIYTKLRPFVFEFLDKLKDKFLLHIYTMGERPYALDMAKLLDPSGKLFDNRIVSRDDSAKDSVKNLDVVLGSCESTLIVDDTEAVWPKHRDNLLRIERYLFFSSTARMYSKISGLIETGSDERPEGGQLEVLLRVLLSIHEKHFSSGKGNPTGTVDVREALKQVRGSILKGVNVVFSGVIPVNHEAPNTTKIWRLAEEMGATVSQKVATGVTHVVAASETTEKAMEGKALGCCMVSPSWLEHCAVVWEKVDPANHPVRK